MADRRSSFSLRFWSQPGARRSPVNRNGNPPAAIPSTPSPPKAESQTTTRTPSNRTDPPPVRTSANRTDPPPVSPPTAETKSPAGQSTIPENPPITAGQSTNPENPPITEAAAETSINASPSPKTESQTTSQTSVNGNNPPPAPGPPKTETGSPVGQTTTTRNGTAIIETQTTMSTNASASPADRSQTSPLSRATTQPPPAIERASPSRKVAQSRSPPLPSSPAPTGTQTRSTPSSPSRMGLESPKPQRALQPRSPSRLIPRSPKQVSSPVAKAGAPASPSKASLRLSEEILNPHAVPTMDPAEKGSNLAPSQPEIPELKAVVKYDSDNQEVEDITSNKQKKSETETEPISTPAEGLTPPPPPENRNTDSIVNSEQKPIMESNPDSEEITEVKEIVQSTKAEAIEERKEVDHDFLKQKSEAQAARSKDAPGKSAQLHGKNNDSPETNEKSTTSKPTNTNSQPRIRIMSKTQNHTTGDDIPLQKDITKDISAFVNRIGMGDPKGTMHDRPVNVITLAGENRGASMEMGSNSAKREGPVHIHRGYKINNPEESSDVSRDGEGSSKRNNQEDAKATEDPPTEAYVNNNAQGINNSIVFNSSVTEGSPGVHMVINLVPKEKMESMEKTRPETRKAEFNMTRAEKLTYEPAVRRRCLRGLFLEPSDSDQENPEKPRRHGCLVSCKQMGEENNIDVL